MFEILVATVILKDNKVLMVKEQKEDIRGLLNLPAGHLEKGETLIQGAIREVKEETGIDASIIKLIDMQYFSRGEKDYVAFVFQGELNQGQIKSINELEFDFYDIQHLKANPDKLRNERLILSALDRVNCKKDVLKILG